jgi:Bacterial membrane protein YfhO
MKARAGLPLMGLGCFLGLLLVVFRPVLFEDGQFAFRDAACFYYPLYMRVQQEWDAGRWPLWDPWQSAGIPLLGNAMSAVLYPGKILYAVLPYPWAARLYVIAHTIVAFLGMFALGRSLGVSWVGSHLAGLSYAFGGPVLFQYSNVIFLVGAAWVPWGLRAIDRLLRLGRRWGAIELAVILALQVLGGDPGAAYLTAICGVGYAVVLATRPGAGVTRWLTWWKILAAVCVWIGVTLGLAFGRLGPPRFTVMNGLGLAAWLAIALGIAWHWRRHRAEAQLAAMLARLAGACTLAMVLAAAQVLPTLEFASVSRRGAGMGASEIYRFSLEPFRIIELFCPNVFGIVAPKNQSWLGMVPPAGDHNFWVPSLYIGLFSLVLALGAIRWKSAPPWCAWMTTIAILALAASFGKHGGPLWWARWGPFAGALGPHDPIHGDTRPDTFPGDGIGSVYSFLVLFLPGFGVFRYPSKLLTFFAAAMAVLAGAGWDRAAAGETGWLRRLSQVGLATTLVGLAMAWAVHDRAVAWITGRIPVNLTFGPADAAAAWTETERSFAHGASVFAAVLLLAAWAPRRRSRAGALALVVLVIDLAVANASLVWTTPQADFDVPSDAARQIEAAERINPSPGPFRIHRMTSWCPAQFLTMTTDQRLREANAWERATLRPLFGLPLGLEYCETVGNMELDDYVAFFAVQPDMPVPAKMARILGVQPDHPIFYFPRRSYDFWGARYFILPASADWGTPERGFASFLGSTDLLYPDRAAFDASGGEGRAGDPWAVRHDWQLRRNRAVYPRAWLVHSARVRPLASRPDVRDRLTDSLIFMNDPIWNDRDRPVYNLRESALIETDDREGLKKFLPGTPIGPTESVAVTAYDPTRVELKATMDRPGVVILADAYYPGWRLRIDGQNAPIYRANRLMRGAAVPAGVHTLVFTYEPASFRVGLVVCSAGVVVLLFLAWSCWRQPRIGSFKSSLEGETSAA